METKPNKDFLVSKHPAWSESTLVAFFCSDLSFIIIIIDKYQDISGIMIVESIRNDGIMFFRDKGMGVDFYC